MAEPSAEFRVYKDKAGEWRWSLVAPNGRMIADSGEGYTSKQGCLNGIDSVKQNAPRAKIVDTTT